MRMRMMVSAIINLALRFMLVVLNAKLIALTKDNLPFLCLLLERKDWLLFSCVYMS